MPDECIIQLCESHTLWEGKFGPTCNPIIIHRQAYQEAYELNFAWD